MISGTFSELDFASSEIYFKANTHPMKMMADGCLFGALSSLPVYILTSSFRFSISTSVTSLKVFFLRKINS